jgi:GAF domain-containing protein
VRLLGAKLQTLQLSLEEERVEDHPYSPELIDNLNELHGLLSEETLHSTLQRVAQLARATLDGCDAAGVTLIEDSTVSTAAATDEFTLKIDQDQYDTGEGPCLQALSTQEVVLAEDVAHDSRWPRFSAEASKEGLASVLSMPLRVRDKGVGALNLYSKTSHGFEHRSRPLAALFASQASVAISNAQTYMANLRVAEQLQEAIKSREVIGEAKGILLAREGVSEEEAFQMLVRVSQSSNVKLRDLAQKVVEEAIKA